METLNSAAIVTFVREKAGLTQTELAERAGTSQPAVARYENGSANPSTATLQRLTRAAGYEMRVRLIPVKASNLSTDRAKKLRRARGEITSLLAKAGANNVRIFGSVARGEDKAGSDIDLLVDFDVDQGLLPILHLNQDLSRLLKEKVEVSPERMLKPDVLARALAEAVPL